MERSEQQTPKWEEIHGLEMGQSCNLNLLMTLKIAEKHIHPSLHEIHYISRSKQGEEELQLQEVPISLHQSLV